jgi:hypothetical protein
MGVEIVAIIPHEFDAKSAVTIPEILNSSDRLTKIARDIIIATTRDPSRLDAQPINWHWDDGFTPPSSKDVTEIWNHGRELLEVAGPKEMIYFSNHQCQISSFLRFAYFLTDTTIQNLMRQYFVALHDILNPEADARVAIYVPDSAYIESRAVDEYNMTFDDLRKWVVAQFGPPAAELESIYTQQGGGVYELRGYFIDEFQDLTSRTNAT